MGAALEGGYDLAAVVLLGVALALLLAAKGLTKLVAGVIDFSIFGIRPLHGVAVALENAVIHGLDDAIKSVEKLVARFLSGLIDAFGLLIAIPLVLGLGVKAALTYLWNTALPALLHEATAALRTAVNAAKARLDSLEDVVAANVVRAEEYARGRASAALSAARAYVDHELTALAATLRADISAALSRAEAYANEAVAKLRSAEDAALANAVAIAAAAAAAGERATAAALATAEADISAGISRAEREAASALAAADAAGKAALDAVRSIAITAETDIETVLGELDPLRAAALIASIPAIATLVHAIATEAGLENAECRSKVKGICRTNPGAWEGLLAGLAVVGGAFTLADLLRAALAELGHVDAVIGELAHLAEADVTAIGEEIGAAALRIAA